MSVEISAKHVRVHKSRSVGPTTAILETSLRAIAAAQHVEAAKAFLRANGEPLTRAAIAAVAGRIRREFEEMARDIEAGRLPENEKLSAGNRKARRAAYARARKAGA